jgi:hypothetical protein
MSHAPRHPAAAAPPSNFPVAWPSYGDSLLHWSRDSVRGPQQMTRLDASLITLWTDSGYGHVQRVYGMPVRVRHAVVNSWLYVTVEPASPDAVVMANLRDGVEPAASAALRSMADVWSLRWLPEMVRTGAELDSIATDEEARSGGEDLDRVARLGSRLWQIRAEMAVPAEHAIRALERASARERWPHRGPRSPFELPLPLVSSLLSPPSAPDLPLAAGCDGEPPRVRDAAVAQLLARACEAAGLGAQQRILLDSRLNRAAVRAVTAAGRRLAAEDSLDDPVDAFHLSLEELRHGLSNGGDLRLRAAAGRAELARYRSVNPPPKLGADGSLEDPFGWAIGDVRSRVVGAAAGVMAASA